MKNNLEKLKSAKAVPLENLAITEIKLLSETHSFPIMVQSNVK
jgi:hypothetical protein